ncbi:MAG TPA: hypothetical protein VHL78_01545, partial [Actinomycetota bacterium]|nr:hypothetical protein [Actinomycetota bacterium]
MRKLRITMALGLVLSVALGTVAVAHPEDPDVLSPLDAHHQHGGDDGHLDEVQENVELVGKLDLFEGGEQPGRISDVGVFGDHAYLGAFYEPNCEDGGVYVVDISDPANPTEARFIPTSPGSYVGEGVQVLDLNVQNGFKGQVLLFNNENCYPVVGGGV